MPTLIDICRHCVGVRLLRNPSLCVQHYQPSPFHSCNNILSSLFPSFFFWARKRPGYFCSLEFLVGGRTWNGVMGVGGREMVRGEVWTCWQWWRWADTFTFVHFAMHNTLCDTVLCVTFVRATVLLFKCYLLFCPEYIRCKQICEVRCNNFSFCMKYYRYLFIRISFASYFQRCFYS